MRPAVRVRDGTVTGVGPGGGRSLQLCRPYSPVLLREMSPVSSALLPTAKETGELCEPPAAEGAFRAFPSVP